MLIRRARDLHRCIKCIGSFTENQATVLSWDSDHLDWILVQIAPNSGPYTGGKYKFMITFDKNYPKHPPQVDCTTPIYHPNIDMTGDDYNVCLSLFDEWQSCFGLEDVIQGLLFLLHNPNLEDPLSPWFDPSMSLEEFTENLQKTLRGELIEDAMNYKFPKMIETEVKTVLEENVDAAIDKLDDCVSVPSEIMTTDVQTVKPVSVNSHTEMSEEVSDSYQTDAFSSGNEVLNNNETTNNPIKLDETGNEGETRVEEEAPQGNNDVNSLTHNDIINIIEDKFLTGFSELLAIDLFDDVDSDDTMSDDDSYYSDGSFDDAAESDQCDTCIVASPSVFTSWRSAICRTIHSAVDLYLGPRRNNGSSNIVAQNKELFLESQELSVLSRALALDSKEAVINDTECLSQQMPCVVEDMNGGEESLCGDSDDEYILPELCLSDNELTDSSCYSIPSLQDSSDEENSVNWNSPSSECSSSDIIDCDKVNDKLCNIADKRIATQKQQSNVCIVKYIAPTPLKDSAMCCLFYFVTYWRYKNKLFSLGTVGLYMMYRFARFVHIMYKS